MKAKVTIESLDGTNNKLEFETEFDEWLCHMHVVEDRSDHTVPYIKHKSIGKTIVFSNLPGLLSRIQDFLNAIDHNQGQFINPTSKRHPPLG